MQRWEARIGGCVATIPECAFALKTWCRALLCVLLRGSKVIVPPRVNALTELLYFHFKEKKQNIPPASQVTSPANPFPWNMPKDCGLRTSSEPSYIVGQLTLWCLPVSLSFIPEAGQGLKSHLGHSPVHFELRRGNPVLCLPSISFVNLTKSVSHSVMSNSLWPHG